MPRLCPILASLKPKTFLPLVDLLLVNVAVVAALWIWTLRDEWRVFNAQFVLARTHWFLAISVAWLILAVVQDFYAQRTQRQLLPTFTTLFGITTLLLVLYFAIYFFAPRNNTLPRGVVLSATAVAFVLVGAWRLVYIALTAGLSREALYKPVSDATIPMTTSADRPISLAAPNPADPRVLTVQEVAEILKVSQATVWRWCQSGKLPAFRVGQQWRIRATDLQMMMQGNEERVVPASSRQKAAGSDGR
jgi:excisionase family DNA binding protein